MKLKKIKFIRFKGLLVGAILLFWFAIDADLVINPKETGLFYVLGYMISIMLVAFWSILNYIDNLRINPIYRSFTKIDKFINALSVKSDERQEIKQMMEDYVSDQVKSGELQDVAEKQIIKQFQDNEFQVNSSFFYTHSYNYILQIGIIFLGLSMLLFALESLFVVLQSTFLMAFETTFLCFGVEFVLIFVMYRLLNRILLSK